MLCTLLTSLALAAASPQVISLEVGLVRVSPHRPGTDKTWVIPAERKEERSGDPCQRATTPGKRAAKKVAAVAAKVGGIAARTPGVPPQLRLVGFLGEVGFSVVEKELCGDASAPGVPAQARMDTAPDIYVRVTGDKVLLRSYTVARTLSNTFRWRAVVPVAAIPTSGLVLEVLNDDGSPDEDGKEVIGQTRLTAEQLLAAANAGALITITDGGVEKLELVVEAASAESRRKAQTLDVRQGIVGLKDFSIAAGEVVEVQAKGEYRVAGRAAPVPATGGAGAASRTFQGEAFEAGAPGAAVVLVGKRRLATGAPVSPCAALLSPYESAVFVGINNQDPSKAQGDLEFDVTVRPATPAEWRTGSAVECKANAAPEDNGELLAAFTTKAVRWLKTQPGLAAAILKNTHPTGYGPSLRSIDVDPSSKTSTRVFVTFDWKGGILNGAHATRVAWEFNTRRHIAATLVADNANVRVSPKYLKMLDAFFRDQVFPRVR